METIALREELAGPERLLQLAENGEMTKRELVRLLAEDKRQAFLDACAAIEKRYTDECGASGSPCLEGGCAVEGEVCLQPLLRAEVDYFKACGQAWSKLFADPRNRAEPWTV
jgi:hypothetical protein